MKNIKKYDDLASVEITNGSVNEMLDASKVSDCVELLYEAQTQMEDALENLQGVYRHLQGTELSSTAERLRSYIIGHLEPMISSDHGWMTRAVSIEEIIEELKESGFDGESIEEE
jgi:hypothetical protein